MARLQEQYVNEIAPALNKKFGYKSVMQIPKLDKVIINVAAGEAKENAKVIDAIVADLGQITGQKAIVCKARKSVANFKLREGMPIGAKVTLRGERMYEFVDRLFNVALPHQRQLLSVLGLRVLRRKSVARACRRGQR
ncbi:large ribosomal subunit protein uL5 [Gemmiger formicilis]|uniref:large ribosomal subunit protein uL5 n=1 Tax=Gemmiger formicilis TaxID=745368 RepID=UPI003CCB0EFC